MQFIPAISLVLVVALGFLVVSLRKRVDGLEYDVDFLMDFTGVLDDDECVCEECRTKCGGNTNPSSLN